MHIVDKIYVNICSRRTGGLFSTECKILVYRLSVSLLLIWLKLDRLLLKIHYTKQRCLKMSGNITYAQCIINVIKYKHIQEKKGRVIIKFLVH